MYYYLYPPFFIIDPQTSFDKAWEVFCCQLLQLEHQTGEIHRRGLPEAGVDLFWPAQGIAYQCKSTENGQGGKISLTAMKKSLNDALQVQQDLGWQRYVFCTNVEVAGKHSAALRQIYPHIDFYGPPYWQLRCQSFHAHVTNRFRIIVPLMPTYPSSGFEKAQQRYEQEFAPHFQREYGEDQLLKAYFFIDTYKGGFDIQLPMTFTAAEALHMLIELLQLPGALYLREYNTTIAPLHRLFIDEKEIPLHQQLGSLALPDRPLMMLLRVEPQVMGKTLYRFEGATSKARIRTRSRYTPAEKAACGEYQQRIEAALDRASAPLKHDL